MRIVVDFSTRRPVTILVFFIAAVVFGVVAFRDLAVDLLPEITYPSLTIRTEFEGTAPSEVESLITKPIENAVGVVNNVVRVVSSSRSDTSEVTLEFGWDANMDMAALDVRERLDLVVLPDDADRPSAPALRPVARPNHATRVSMATRTSFACGSSVSRRSSAFSSAWKAWRRCS